MTELKPGAQLASAVCATRVVVVRVDDPYTQIRCGGAPMVPAAAPDPSGGPQAGEEGPTLIGKRYVNAAGTIELLCTKSGDGRLSIAGVPLDVKSAKPLPSSD